MRINSFKVVGVEPLTHQFHIVEGVDFENITIPLTNDPIHNVQCHIQAAMIPPINGPNTGTHA